MVVERKFRLKRSSQGKVLRIGTRGSLLAMTQAGEIKRKLEKKFPWLSCKLVIIRTQGDEFQSVELFKRENTGVFTKAIEEALLKHRVDVAVHSLKDLPTELPKALCLAVFPKRRDPADVLISRQRYTLETIPKSAVVGTGSPRRKRQVQLARPDLRLVDIRGNLDTRVKKVLKERKYDAVIVAKAGIARIKKYSNYAVRIPLNVLMPAVGQAALGIETRKNDKKTIRLLKFLNDAKTETLVSAERSFLRELKGGCRVPVGVLSSLKGNTLSLKAGVFSASTQSAVTGQIQGRALDFERLAKVLARKLLKKGADKLLKEARS